MGRALRRQQERAARRQQRQERAGRGQRPQMTAPPAPAEASRGHRFVPRWMSDIISELRKVTWPTRHEVGYLTAVVVIVSAFFGAILGAADLGFSWLIENTVLR